MKTVRPKVRCSVAIKVVEVAGADRVEAGGRLVEKHDLGIERERTGQRHTLDHAARQLRRKLARRLEASSPTISSFAIARSRPSDAATDLRYSRIGNWRFCQHRQRREQRALLEQDAPAPLDVPALRSDGSHRDRCRRPRCVPARLWHQPDDGAHQHRLAGARRADEAEDFAAIDVEIGL